jgi:ornithine--oxo-acid transaminase
MTALRVLVDENLAERADVLGEKFRSAIRAFNSPLVKAVRGRGLLNAVVMDEDQSSKGRTAWQFCLLLKSRGVLAKPTHVNMFVLTYSLIRSKLTLPSNSIRFAPPLVISEEDLMKVVRIIEESLVDLDKASFTPDSMLRSNHLHLLTQLDEIPGEVESEKGHQDSITN